MKRFEWQNDGMVVVGAELEYAPMDTHEFVVYEEARLIEVDRDIKAANLQLLVEKVLYMDAAGERFEQNTDAAAEDTLGDAWQRASEELVDLAQSLKQ